MQHEERRTDMANQEQRRCRAAIGAKRRIRNGVVYRDEEDEVASTTWALLHAVDSSRFQYSSAPHPVQARDAGLIKAWEQWPLIHAPIAGWSLAMQTIDPSRAYVENDALFKVLFDRGILNGRALAPVAAECLLAASIHATATTMFWKRPHALIELTPALEQMLASSDLGSDIPVSHLRPPFPVCFIRFGTVMQPELEYVDESHVTGHINGVYVFEAPYLGTRALSIIAIHEFDTGEAKSISIGNMMIDDENESLLDVLARLKMDPRVASRLGPLQYAIAQACMKVSCTGRWTMRSGLRKFRIAVP
jgi:hypothetical protein